MFISITFKGTSIDETNKTQQKVRGSKFMFKMSTIHANTCIQTTTPLHGRCCCDDGVVQQPPLAQQIRFFQLLHVMDLRTVDPLLKDTPDAVVHRIQIWRIGWPISRGINYGVFLSAAWWQCHVHGERHDFSDVNITSPGKGCRLHGTQRSKFTSMVSINLQSCVPKIKKNPCIFVKVIVKKIGLSGTFFMWTWRIMTRIYFRQFIGSKKLQAPMSLQILGAQ